VSTILIISSTVKRLL